MSFDFTEAQMGGLIQELKKRLGLIKFFARLGDSDDLSVATVDEPGRKGFVRVRLQNDDMPYRVVKSGLLGGYNSDPGTPVIIGYDEKGKLAIEKMDHDGIREYGGNPLIYNTGDRRMSAFTATDGLRPLMTGAVSGNDDTGTQTNEIFVDKLRFSHNNTVKEFEGAKVDLTSLVPAANLHRYICVFLRVADLVLEVAGSTAKATITPLTDTDKQECYDQRSDLTIPVAMWRLSDAQTVVTASDYVEDLRPWLSSIDTGSGQINVESILLETSPTGIVEVGGLIYWNEDEYTLNVVTGLGPVLQVGQEIYILFYNDTGGELANLTVMRPVAGHMVGSLVLPTFEKAQGDDFAGAEGTIVVTTMVVPDGQVGLATRFGRARGGDTSSFSQGDDLYISPTTAGAITNVKPAFPDWDIKIGGVVVSDASIGEIFVSITTTIADTFQNFWNGTFREAFDLLITSNGTIVTATLTPTNGHPDMTMVFSDVGFELLDTDPGATIALTPGADDETLQANFIFIPASTKVLTLSTVRWPTTFEHIRVAEVRLVTAATTQLEGGARRNQNWNDEVQNTTTNQGHLSHIGVWIRAQPARWLAGTGAATTLNGTGTLTDVWVVSDPGDVLQFHQSEFPVQDMIQHDIDAVSTGSKTFTISDDGDLTKSYPVGKRIHVHNSTGNDGSYIIASINYSAPDFVITVNETIPSAVVDGTIGDFIIVINDSVTALRKSINLNDITVDSAGATLNNKWFNITIWGVRNKSGELSYLMCNLPSGNSYLTEANAIADASNETVYTIPDDYNGVGFLIARFTLRKSGANFTYNGGTAYVDLRGQFPSTAAGGGGGGAGGGTMSSFTVAADSGTPETIVDGDAITHTGGVGMSTTVAATDEITYDASIDAAGLSGGQTLNGGLDASDDLTLSSTANATKGSIFLSDLTEFIEDLDRLGIGKSPGAFSIDAAGSINVGGYLAVSNEIHMGTSGGPTDPGYTFSFDPDTGLYWVAANTLGFTAAGVKEAQIGIDGLTLKSGTGINEFSIDGTLAGDSDNAAPTEKAVKAYVDITRIVAQGGTGRASHTAYGVLCGGTTTTAAQQSIAGVGTSGQVLTSNGAAALPTFQAAGAGSSPLTTKGDLWGYDTGDERVPIGTNDYRLVADSAQALGLKWDAPPDNDVVDLDEDTDFTTSSTSFNDVDATALALSITTTGGSVIVGFAGTLRNTGSTSNTFLNISVDGVDHAANDGIYRLQQPTSASASMNASFSINLGTLAAGTYALKLRWKVSSGTATLWGGGTAGADVHANFWAQEVK